MGQQAKARRKKDEQDDTDVPSSIAQQPGAVMSIHPGTSLPQPHPLAQSTPYPDWRPSAAPTATDAPCGGALCSSPVQYPQLWTACKCWKYVGQHKSGCLAQTGDHRAAARHAGCLASMTSSEPREFGVEEEDAIDTDDLDSPSEEDSDSNDSSLGPEVATGLQHMGSGWEVGSQHICSGRACYSKCACGAGRKVQVCWASVCLLRLLVA